MKSKISPHHREELGRLPGPFAKRGSATEDRTDFRRRVSARSDVSGSQGAEQIEFAGVPFRRRFQRFEQFQAFRKVTDRLDMGEAVPGSQPRLQAIPDCLLHDPRFDEVLREQFRLGLNQMCEPRFHDLSNLLMKSAARWRVDRTSQRLFEQRVLKNVHACWRLTFDNEEAGGYQLSQLGPQRLLV